MAIRADYINSGPNLKEISDLFSMFAYYWCDKIALV